jgi:hypothetical protein
MVGDEYFTPEGHGHGICPRKEAAVYGERNKHERRRVMQDKG